MMRRQISIVCHDTPQEKKLRVRMRPLALTLLLFVLLLLFLIVKAPIEYGWDSYFPYEGIVLKIETCWLDWLASEFMSLEHLIIETPEGKIIDKVVSMDVRIPNRVQAGDYVVKRTGFGNPVRPRDKKTTREILEQWNSRK
ncbi:MAG: hypothetical protein JXI33_04885 [Candidatus Aminicenantes bacterium]|nr:hypothetical protein [Candidatus Aminicenantes bacterium]